MGALKIKHEEEHRRDCAAIDPCSLCPHSQYKYVDKRCITCGLKGKRFFEIISTK